MEVQCTPLGWPHFCHEEEMEEVRHTLLYTSLELESTIVSAKEEIARREVEMLQMKDLLSKAMKERDEAQAQCQKLVVDNLILQQHMKHQNQQVPKKDHELETSPQCEAYTSSEGDDTKEKHQSKETALVLAEEVMELAFKKALPAKGKLLQAVMEAGPLLKTLLLAGPLPQWQHPPPKLDSIEIPPVTISSSSSSSSHSPSTPLGLNCFTKKKRSAPMPLYHDDSLPSPDPKCPKFVRNPIA